MALGIAREERKLAHEILDVVKDEGKSAIEFFEALRIGERFLTHCFGKRACRLLAGGSQKVEILPVERAPILRRREEDEADQTLLMEERHCRPRSLHRSITQLRNRQILVGGLCPAMSEPLELDDPAAFLESLPKLADCDSRSGEGHSPGQFQLAAIAGEPLSPTINRPPGASTTSAKALTIRSLRGGASGPSSPSVSVNRSHSVR